MTNLQIALIKYREKYHISQTELANKIGCTRNALANWETGRTTPKAEVYKLIAERLNCNLSYLLGETSSPSAAPIQDEALIALYNQTEGLSKEQMDQVISYVQFLKSKENK
ncbi:MAG: helix-turn-helix domain-containing protein [Anaeroplasma bactoclasticum]|nr:helix-turn-helix domain-containing protein [Anaeroplasma bactoclasticum]